MYNKGCNYFEGRYMNELSIFKNMKEEEISLLLKNIGARKIKFKKDQLIFSTLDNDGFIGIILYGNANIIKYDFNGNKTIIDTLEYNSILGRPFSNYDNDVSIMASSECEILFLDYNDLLQNDKWHLIINNNIIEILSEIISKLNERVELLSKRSIREKLLCYFGLLAKKRKRKSFSLPLTYIELANYLSIDRSAMMREIKKMKQDGIISTDGNKITLIK